MSKRRDAALKRAIERAWDEPAATPSATIANIYVAMLRFTRREKAKAWDECAAALGRDGGPMPRAARVLIKHNPYRGRARR